MTVNSFLYVTDLHLTVTPPPSRSTDPFHRLALDKLEALITAYQPALVVVGGDLFHARSKARPCPPLSLLLDLRWFMANTGVEWILVPGNHDCAFDVPDRANSPLALLEGGNVRVAWGGPWAVAGFTSPREYPERFNLGDAVVDLFPWAGDTRLPGPSDADVVVVHASVAPGAQPFDVFTAADLPAQYPNAQVALLGHIHQRYTCLQPTAGGYLRVVNPGPLVRRTVEEVASQPDGAAVYLTCVDGAVQAEVVPVGDNTDVIQAAASAPVSAVDVAAILQGAGGHAFDPVDDSNVERLLAEFSPQTPGAVVARAVELFQEARL